MNGHTAGPWPDLLAAAEEMVNDYDRWFRAQDLTLLDVDGDFLTILSRLRAAAQKARGKS